MANYQNLHTLEILSECDFYDCLFTKCCYYCSADWLWENLTTHVTKTGQNWKTYFKVNPPSCNCLDPNCPNGREIAYLNLIQSITLAGESSQFVELTLDSAIFVDNESVVPPTPDYVVDWGDGSPTESITIGVELHHAPLATGILTGTITWQDASIQFWYGFNFGIVTALQLQRTTDLSLDLDCALYPNYPITLTDSATIDIYSITDASGYVFGNNVFHVAPNDVTYNENGQLLTDYVAVTDTIFADYTGRDPLTGDPLGTFTNTGVLRTRCIS